MATYIGIDIGSCYTKLVELECNPGPVLLNRIIFQTPCLSQDQPGVRQIDTNAFWREIAKYIPLERIRASRIAASLSPNAASSLTLILPQAANNELNIMAQTEARRKMIPASGPEHIFESSILGTRIVAKIPRFEVLAVRSEKHHVQRLLEIFQAVNAVPEIITSSGYALFTLLPEEVLTRKDTDAAFVDIGLDSINTSIMKEGRLNFFRNTSFGLRDIIQDISKQLELPEDAVAEAIKEKGIPEVNFDLKNRVALAEEIMRQKYEAGTQTKGAGPQENLNLLELRMLWQSHIERILHELRRSLSYYKEQTEGRRVEYLYFLGGGCLIKNLVSILVKQVGGQWEILLPFKGMRIAAGKETEFAADAGSGPIFTQAAALALCLCQLKVKPAEIINFLPPELKRKKIIAARLLIFLLVKIILMSTLSLSSLLLFVNNRVIKAAVKKTEAELSGIKDVSDTLKELNARENKIKERLAQIEALLNKRPNFSSPLYALGRALPKEILLTAASINKAGGEAAQLQGILPKQETLPFMPAEFQDAGGIPGPAPAQITGGPDRAIENYRIEIKAELFSDYENSLLIIEAFQCNLLTTSYFGNINITPLTLENISPQLPGAREQEITLTRPMRRTFILSADIYAAK